MSYVLSVSQWGILGALKVYLTHNPDINPVSLVSDAQSGGGCEQSGLHTKLRSLSSELSGLSGHKAPLTPGDQAPAPGDTRDPGLDSSPSSGPTMVFRPSPPLKFSSAGSAPSLAHTSHLQPSVFTGQSGTQIKYIATQFSYNSCQKLFACRCANLVHAEILQNYSPWRVLNTRYSVQRLPVIRMSHIHWRNFAIQDQNRK